MNRFEETIVAIFGLASVFSIGSGLGIILLYRQGDVFSHIIVFLAMFGLFFLITEIKGQTDKDTFLNDLFGGIIVVLILGLIRFLGDYLALSIITALLSTSILIYKTRPS